MSDRTHLKRFSFGSETAYVKLHRLASVLCGFLCASANVALAASPVVARPEYPSRQPAVEVFRPGEKHEIEVTYLGIPGLNVVMELMPMTTFAGRKAFHAHGAVKTSSLVGLFYRVNDSVDSWFDHDSLFSHRLQMVQDESSIQRTSIETFDPLKGEELFSNRWTKSDGSSHASDEKFALPPFVQDTLSAAYYLRTLPLEKGAVFKVPVASEGNLINVQVTVTDTLTVTVEHERIEAFTIHLAKLDAEGKAVAGPNNVVYLSADSRRRILGFNVWSRFGQIRASLKKYTEGGAVSP